MTRITLEAPPARVSVAPEAGGRLASIEIAGRELLCGEESAPNDVYAWGCYPMAPWAGRLRRGTFAFDDHRFTLPSRSDGHALHGTTLERPWTVDDADGTVCTLSCDLGPTWPWPGRVSHRIEVAATAVELRLEISSGGAAMPAACGWHPWWRRRLDTGGDVEIDLPAETLLPRDTQGIPDGRTVRPGPRPEGGWDDCFTHVGRNPVLRWPGAMALTLVSSCRYWVLFDQPPHAVCLEPQTGPPDALNTGAPGAALVGPGRPLRAQLRLEWELG